MTPDEAALMTSWGYPPDAEPGETPKQKPQSAPADAQPGETAEAGEPDFDALHTPGKVGQFEIPPMEGVDEKVAFEVAKQANVWLADLGVSREQGSALAREIGRVAAETEHMDASAFATWQQKQRIAMETLWGPEGVERIALARQLAGELMEKHPELREILNQSGAGSSPAVISALYFRARQLQARQAKQQ